jgi:hypothetical protein
MASAAFAAAAAYDGSSSTVAPKASAAIISPFQSAMSFSSRPGFALLRPV